MHTPKLTVLEKVGFGAGDMAVNVVISSMFLIVAFFYTDIFGLTPTHMGVLFLAARLQNGTIASMSGAIMRYARSVANAQLKAKDRDDDEDD